MSVDAVPFKRKQDVYAWIATCRARLRKSKSHLAQSLEPLSRCVGICAI